MTTAASHDPAPALTRARSAFEAGNFAEAEQLCHDILATNQDFFDALFLLAVAQMNLGKMGAALASYDRALMVRPENAEAHFSRGVILETMRRRDEALASYDRAIALRPEFAGAFFRRGSILQERGRHEDALADFDRAIRLRPNFAQAHLSRANALNTLNRFDEALAGYNHGLGLQPNNASAYSNRGNVLQALNRFEEALASYDRAVSLQPKFPLAYYNRGNVLQDLNRYGEALLSYEHAIGLRPDFPQALSNRGNVLQRLKRFDEAIASYDRALVLQPDFAEAHSNRGAALQEMNRHEEALTSFVSAYKALPSYADAHFHEALCRLLLGDFDRGWEIHEWRWKIEQLRMSKRDFPQPWWLGKGDIAGKTILLYAEQAFGDTIQFCRYAPLVAARGARVILEVQEPLTKLMCSLAGTAQIFARDAALPDFDLQCPLLSLPLAFGTLLETIPAATPYLGAPEQSVQEWDAKIGPRNRPRIGLAWSGRPSHKNDHNRSIRLSALLSLLEFDATFVSLQKDLRPWDAPVLQAQSNLLHFGDEIKDFSDTAALISNLDLVISVDTSVAHLAGALAKPAWVMLPFNPDWRWLLNRDDSPWYPNLRLFRQDESHAWDNVFPRVHAALGDFIQRPSRI